MQKVYASDYPASFVRESGVLSAGWNRQPLGYISPWSSPFGHSVPVALRAQGNHELDICFSKMIANHH